MHTLQYSLHLQAETDSWGSQLQEQSASQSLPPIRNSPAI